MAIGGTTIGPVSEDVRDRLKDYRDRQGHPHYEAALRELLQDRAEDNA